MSFIIITIINCQIRSCGFVICVQRYFNSVKFTEFHILSKFDIFSFSAIFNDLCTDDKQLLVLILILKKKQLWVWDV